MRQLIAIVKIFTENCSFSLCLVFTTNAHVVFTFFCFIVIDTRKNHQNEYKFTQCIFYLLKYTNLWYYSFENGRFWIQKCCSKLLSFFHCLAQISVFVMLINLKMHKIVWYKQAYSDKFIQLCSKAILVKFLGLISIRSIDIVYINTYDALAKWCKCEYVYSCNCTHVN